MTSLGLRSRGRRGVREIGRAILILAMAALLHSCAEASSAADNIQEEIISVRVGSGLGQSGVLSRLAGARPAKKLMVLVSGSPGVTRPRLDDKGKVTTRQNGNFLVRSRNFLVSSDVMTLLLDCRSDFDAFCPDDYQASPERAQDVEELVSEVRRRFPAIEAVWAVSTSRGTITTAGLLNHKPDYYSGIVHTAGTYGIARSYGLDFGPHKTPQFIFHHRDDPCRGTMYRDARELADKWGIILVSVSGGGGFRGDPCQAFTQHGFTGREEKVASAIRRLVESGTIEGREIE